MNPASTTRSIRASFSLSTRATVMAWLEGYSFRATTQLGMPALAARSRA